jgi:hypothetical protein
VKVTQEKAFAPITIVLETEAEAREMWARLDVSCNDVNKRPNTYGYRSDQNISAVLFFGLNDKYDYRVRKDD